MKIVLIALSLIFSASAFAAETTLPVTYELAQLNATCKANCTTDEDDVEVCRYRIFFDDASFQKIKDMKARTWFQKTPTDICEAGELPDEADGYAPITVLLYSVDFKPLSTLFE